MKKGNILLKLLIGVGCLLLLFPGKVMGAKEDDPFKNFIMNGYYNSNVEGTPLKFAEKDIDGDGLLELIIYTYAEDGTKRYYVWFQATDSPYCFTAEDVIGNKEPSLYVSAETGDFVTYINTGSEEFFYCYYFIDRKLYLNYRVGRKKDDALTIIYKDDGTYENPEILLQYYDENDSNKVEELSMWENIVSKFISVEFYDLTDTINSLSEKNGIEMYVPVINQYRDAQMHRYYTNEIYAFGNDADAAKEYLQSQGKYLDISVVENAARSNNYKPEAIPGSNGGDEYHLYYVLVDLNDDGMEEFLIGGGYGSYEADSIQIYNIFTYDGENPVPVFEINSVGWREALYVYEDNSIFLVDSKGVKNVLYSLPVGSCIPVQYESYNVDWNNKVVEHYASNGELLNTLTYDEFRAQKEKYVQKTFTWIELGSNAI